VLKTRAKFTELKEESILQLFKSVSWRDIGFWMLHFDAGKNHTTAWELLKQKYISRTIQGIIKISTTNEARNGAHIIYIFVGPAQNKAHCLTTGRNILSELQYARQKCHQNYNSFIYYKLPRGSQNLYRLGFSE
jgi:hypothetical protein